MIHFKGLFVFINPLQKGIKMSPKSGYLLRDEIAPRTAAAVPRCVLCIGSEDSGELLQDTVVQGAKMIDRVEAQGKLGRVISGNVAFYCIQHAKSGGRASGCSMAEVHGTQAQLNGHTRLHPMSEVVSETETGDAIHELHDVISTDRENPSTIATRNLDWAVLTQTLTKLERLVIECLTEGMTVREICQRVKMTKAKLAELQGQVAQKIVEVMGAGVLQDIAELPKWRIGLDCERELMAYRSDRQH